MSATTLPAPSGPLPVPRSEMSTRGGAMRDPGQQAEGVVKAARTAGPIVTLTLACIALAGGLVWLAVQREQVAMPDRWTGTDHSRFEMGLETRLAKMDRAIERLGDIVGRQDALIERLSLIVERQDVRIKAMEEWVSRNGAAAPPR